MLSLAALVVGCGPTGSEPDGGAAEPDAGVVALDECGPSEAPLQGGGCRPVGLGGSCWEGFEPTADGACLPILPEGECPDGTMPVVGRADCVPLSECGDGPWGLIEPDAAAVFVDASYEGADPDGSEDRPYPGLAQGLAAAGSGGQIVVAAGEYVGDVQLHQGKRLVGRCPELVTIRGASPSSAAVLLGSPGAELRGVTVTGPGAGVGVIGEGSVVEEVRIFDCGNLGLQVEATSTIRRASIEGSTLLGALLQGGEPVLEEVRVAATRPTPSGLGGYGVQISSHPTTGEICEPRISRSLVEGNRLFGILVTGASIDLEESVVRDTSLDETTGILGVGVQLQVDDSSAIPSSGTIRRSVIEGSHHVGLSVLGSALVGEELQVRDTLPAMSGFIRTFGYGVLAQLDPVTGERGSTELRRSLVEGNRDVGVAVTGSVAILEDLLVRDTLPRPWDGRSGVGIVAHDSPVSLDPSEVEIRGTRVVGSLEAGIMIIGSVALLEDVVVEETLGAEVDGQHGRGIAIQLSRLTGRSAEATLTRPIVRRSREAGLFVSGASARIEDGLVVETEVCGFDGGGGDGVVAARPFAAEVDTTVDLVRTRVESSARAGALFSGAGGSVSESTFVDGLYGLVLELGAYATVAEDNVFASNAEEDLGIGLGIEAPSVFSEFTP